MGLPLKDESELDGWSSERIKFPAKGRDDERQGKRRPVLLLAAGPSSAVTMGKLSSTWCSANNHYGALNKLPLLSGPYIHLKLVGWIITWQFLKCRVLSTVSHGQGNGGEAGLWVAKRTLIKC